jgi:hypothetical protein
MDYHNLLKLFEPKSSGNSLGFLLDCKKFFIEDGWKAIVKFSLLFLLEIKETLLKIDLDSVSGFLKDHLNTDFDMGKIIKNYNGLKVTNRQLINLREEYFISLVKEKLNVSVIDFKGTLESIEDDQIEAINNYRTEKERLEKVVKKEILYYQNELKEVGITYSSIKAELHNQIVFCEDLNRRRTKLQESKISMELNLILMRKEVQNILAKQKLTKIKQESGETRSQNQKIKIIEEEVKQIQVKIRTVQASIDETKESVAQNVKKHH